MAFNPEQYTHESDRTALKALKAIPGFSALLKGFMNVWDERQQKILNMSSRIRLGERQMRKYYDMLPPVCEKLGIPVPELYLEMNPAPNAYTSGDTNPFIVMTSGLLKALPDELISTILAHECGHIACHHVLYQTMGRIILTGAGSVVSSVWALGSLLTVPMKIAFYYWMRCSEFSADRAAALCDGGPQKMQEVCMRLAGWDKEIDAEVDIDAFLEQASGYQEMIQESKWNKTLEFMILSQASHPLLAIRATECGAWAQSDAFRALLSDGTPVSAGINPNPVRADMNGHSEANAGKASLSPAAFRVPGNCQSIASKPGDPPGSRTYGRATTQSDGFIQVLSITAEEALPFGDTAGAAAQAHAMLTEDQGLIESGNGLTAKGNRYAYTLIKTLQRPRSTEYLLTFHTETGDGVTAVRGYFTETGSPGFRTTAIRRQMEREHAGETGWMEANWSRDPFDPARTEGYLMNLSEKPEYDLRYPLHPLSEARLFLKEIIALN